MKFKIISKAFADKSFESTLIKTFEYFATLNKERAEKIEKSNLGVDSNKEQLYSLIQDLVDYVDVGLKKNFSFNFNVIACKTPTFALKYEKGCLLSLQYLDFNILVYKTPFICVPGKYMKYQDEVKTEEVIKEKDFLKKSLLNSNNYLMKNFSYKEKIKEIKDLKQDTITDIIFDNISYCIQTTKVDKDFLSDLAQAIQFDLSITKNDFSFGIVISKKIIYADSFIANSNLIYHSKFISNSGSLAINKDNNQVDKENNVNNDGSKDYVNDTTYVKVKAPKLKDTEILIYHKKAVFESAISNMLSGRFKSVEMKHIFIAISVILFFIVTGFCKGNMEEYNEKESLTWFEENVCKNKSTYISTIGVLFIMIIISGLLKKKLDNSRKKQANKVK